MANMDGGWQSARQRPDAPQSAAGIDVTKTVPEVLLAWQRTITGDWWALATFELTNRSQKPGLVLTPLVPAMAIKQIETSPPCRNRARM